MPATSLINLLPQEKGEQIYTLCRHPLRHYTEAFIRQRYDEDYGARISHFCSRLMVSVFEGEIQSAIGFELAQHRQLFLEQYFSQPVEQVIAHKCNLPTTRGQIVEVGNLASQSHGALRRFILILGQYFIQQHLQWVVFTAIPSLLHTFEKFQIPLYELGEARPDALGEEAGNWGSYYKKSPKVVAAHLGTGMAKLRSNAMLAKLVDAQPTPLFLGQ
ncbi:hypothetical protein BTA51_23260 [Hahella sp. CCB-MM4]|uniref:thermostable hemolysin n=1 Tax=Hahella sp. (strain CCB-MM4) TaxID=1926491 RepID=UPI000B9AE5F4|nr:thermostable hemolysin [Hahella sp. CCB-MM4]OZG71026.1 hypothetical protein BTA51_23260 [Hahella sp. CCB-MM4]